jgi:osmotically-inducible protein OsmY
MKKRNEIMAAAAIAALIFSAAGCGNNNASSASNEMASSPAATSDDHQMGAAERAGKALDETGQGVKNGVHHAAADSEIAAHNAAMNTKMAAHNAAVKTTMAAHQAGHDAKEAGSSVAIAADNALAATSHDVQLASAPLILTPKVKSALIGDSRIDASTINVDTIAAAKQVVLKGTVPNAAKKDLAGQIAAQELAKMQSSFTVKNDLAIKGS